MLEKLKGIKERYEQLTALLSDPAVIGDQNRYRLLIVLYLFLHKCYSFCSYILFLYVRNVLQVLCFVLPKI